MSEPLAEFYDVACEGAYVRTLASAVESGLFGGLPGEPPRSLIVVAAGAIARAAAQAAVQVLSPLPFPVVVVPTLPEYIGVLDVLIVLGEAREQDRWHAVREATRRGVPTVLVDAPGAVTEEAPDETMILPVPTGATGWGSPARALSAVVAVAELMSAGDGFVVDRLLEAAERVDEELTRLSPERDEDANRARQLRNLCASHSIVHSGHPAIASLVQGVWSARGIASAAVERQECAAILQRQPSRDLFFDPFVDEQPPVLPSKVVLWGASPTESEARVGSYREEEPAGISAGPFSDALILSTRGLAATVYPVTTEDL
ncbi:hypothetical protein L1O03_02540 [Corynebacterium uropygiale]|uniref:Bifunctional glucose-6-phosphate/mannose-6-phosphate isomerase C-terminal domain-containing protein n=1 Tax=Corynebacterium uropygiale TaxID=1775911 RepID=A0A9X1QMJ2_9CORY|nr:hypothetical protein [Corynebacterium uropygiale]MCF4006057.1 hypothetical protein [Corynebacterium uropygiale]